MNNERHPAVSVRIHIRTFLAFTLSLLMISGALCIGVVPEAAAYSFSPGGGKEEISVDSEEIYAFAPLDEDGIKAIDAIAKYPETDTWTICVYMVASNLEDEELNELSEVTKLLTEQEQEKNRKASKDAKISAFKNMEADVTENGLSMPEYLYEVNRTVSEESYEEDLKGYASADLSEMKQAQSGDQFRILVQTGGARRWENAQLNPNKTQRIEIRDGKQIELESLPLQDSANPDTLTDFLQFCDREAPADHRILIFWDHGDGPFGFGLDKIFESSFSMNEFVEGIRAAYGTNPDNPPVEVIVFDACLMSNLEVCHCLYGLGRYLVASAELEPSDGVDYTAWMSALKDNTATNGAQIGRAIADSYIDYYVSQTIREGGTPAIGPNEYSVVDISEAEQTYQAYSALATAVMKDASEDPDVISRFYSAAKKTCRYGGSYYKEVNLIDLGMLTDTLQEDYKEQTTRIREHLNKAVLYCRASGYLKQSQGLSVYVPVDVTDESGLYYALRYVNEVSGNDDLRALYYYKVAGCLSGEMRKTAAEKGYGALLPLELDVLKDFSSLPVCAGDGSVSVTVPESYENVVQNFSFQIGAYDEESDMVYYLGDSCSASVSDQGMVVADLDGKWLTLDGIALPVRVADETDSYLRLTSRVLHNGEDSILIISYDKNLDEYSVCGVHPLDVNADIYERGSTSLRSGDLIAPLYATTDLKTNEDGLQTLDTIRYTENSRIEMRTLNDGVYYGYFELGDLRGDVYDSAVTTIILSDGAVSELSMNDSLVG